MCLNRQSSIPLYEQVVNYVKEKIRTGQWPVGSRLPAQRKLAEWLKVNRSTISTAFDELAAQGLVKSAHGKGTVVINNTWGLLTDRKPANWQQLIEAGHYKPNLAIIQKINAAEFYPGIIRMGTGELSPDLLPNRKTSELLKNLNLRSFSLGYCEPKGNRQLREEIARYVAGFGIQTAPSSILIVSGALQALQLISIGLLERGTTLLLEKPSYLYSVNVFQSSGMRFAGMPMDSEGMCVDKIEAYKKNTPHSMLYTIPNFHNPTGRLMSAARRKQLLAVSARARLPIIEDDVYRELWLGSPPPLPLKADDHAGNVLYLGSLSKALSPGLRIGWVIGPEPVIDRLADLKMQNDYGSSNLSQEIARAFLHTGAYATHTAHTRAQLKIRRDYLLERLDSLFADLAEWQVPTGGFYIWLKVIPDIHAAALFQEALKQNVLLNPGILYDRDAGQYLRLSYSYASFDQMDEALRTLRRIILEQSQRSF
ncbi:PLP-dependent aminotransferase family protein [Sporolactobacillus sp. CPB3-1]|uniref:PLP-dependent aminotransferase family protein n=1 Tax=Sporolactobacillus mangiferae TaxID=2940498 RepID=A0ABT0M9D2_9BACL|nr:PLP-dependent aminotransferase family protein [Sporolactobacillus mangiferae]MCL1631485.1 PLP-dependent aminotransferase family protein [Sporolactobacillus mangiferae]